MATAAQQAAAKKADFAKTYPGTVVPFDLGSTQFRFTVVRPDYGNVVVDDLVQQVEWRDEGSSYDQGVDLNAIPILRGSLTLIKPDHDGPNKLRHIFNGHRLRCEVFWGSKWRPLWEMRMDTDETQLASAEWRFDLADDFTLLALTNVSARYKKGKSNHRLGWFYHEIIRDLCRTYGIPVGQLARGTHRITSFTDTDQPLLLVLTDVLQREVAATGRNYVMRWGPDSKGRYALNITPLRRNPILYTLSDQIRDATLARHRRATLATTVEATGAAKKGKGKGKSRQRIKVLVTDAAGFKRYGFIKRKITLPGNIDSVSAARAYARRSLAKGLTPIRLIDNVMHTGIPDVRRGDAVRVSIPDEGYVGADGIVFVSSVTHSYGNGDYTMTLTLSFIDPQDPAKLKAQREAALRAAKRKTKGKKK